MRECEAAENDFGLERSAKFGRLQRHQAFNAAQRDENFVSLVEACRNATILRIEEWNRVEVSQLNLVMVS